MNYLKLVNCPFNATFPLTKTGAVDWAKAGFDPNQVRKLSSQGYDPSDATAYITLLPIFNEERLLNIGVVARVNGNDNPEDTAEIIDESTAIVLKAAILAGKYEGVVTDPRQIIINNIYDTAKKQSDQLSSNYSLTEAVRWTEDRAAIQADDWGHFTSRAGSTMTGQQYAETRVVPKLVAGDIFLDKIIAKRTDLLVTLALVADADLETFDYTSMWDSADDYTPPPVEIVTATAWAMLMESIRFNYKFW